MKVHFQRHKLNEENVMHSANHMENIKNINPALHGVAKHILLKLSADTHVRIPKEIPSQLGIFVFTFTVKSFHIYGALIHMRYKVFTFTVPYYIFTFRGATRKTVSL